MKLVFIRQKTARRCLRTEVERLDLKALQSLRSQTSALGSTRSTFNCNVPAMVRVRINEKDRAAHPAVVILCEEDGQDAEFRRVNVLYGSKKPPAAGVQPWQTVLNGTDGLDFRTGGRLRRILFGQQERVLRGSWSGDTGTPARDRTEDDRGFATAALKG